MAVLPCSCQKSAKLLDVFLSCYYMQRELAVEIGTHVGLTKELRDELSPHECAFKNTSCAYSPPARSLQPSLREQLDFSTQPHLLLCEIALSKLGWRVGPKACRTCFLLKSVFCSIFFARRSFSPILTYFNFIEPVFC